ncbi:VOC family protein [Acidothermaceae bacterium B102]|nr:VOC family protein [Acidothermaceae bacterium B102]
MTDSTLTRPAASAAVSDLGWRVIVGELRTAVPITSYEEGARLLARLAVIADVEGLVRVDVREGVALLALRSPDGLTERVLALAPEISEAVGELGLTTVPDASGGRPVQALEIAIDAMDIPAIKPFWAAVMGYDEFADDVVDSRGQSAAIWFQQMDEPRTQRNRIHFDIIVGHDEAAGRIEAAVAAGGHLVSDSAAPSFWILADVEGNEVCVCTWQGRDPA